MDREKIITIAIGLAVGITLAVAYFAGTKLLPKLGTLQNITPTTPAPSKAPAPKLAVTLDSPDDHISTTSATINIVGKTLPNVKLVFFANADEKIATSSADGSFSYNLSLEEGENTISVTAIGSQGNLASTQRNVTMEVSQ